LTREVLLSGKRLVKEQVLLELLQDQELIIQAESMTTEEVNSEMLREMEETQYQILLVQDSTQHWIILVKKDLSIIWEADTSFLLQWTHQDQALITVTQVTVDLNTLWDTDQING